MRVHRELLAKCDLDDGLILATPEERDDAPENRDRKSCCRPHRALILLDSKTRSEAETDSASELPSEDERETAAKNVSKISQDE